ncbi:unnamed protein product [Urochloa humidicola]
MAPKRELFVAAGDGGAPPPGKRLRVEAAPGSSFAEPPSSPKHFLAIVLVVLFLKRPKGRTTDAISISASQFGRLMRNQICGFMNPLFRKLETMDTKLENMGSKLERIEEHVQDLTVKVDNITQLSPNHHDHEHFMQEVNQEATTADVRRLATTEGKSENASIQLRFLNRTKTHVYHDDEIKSENNTAIKIGIFDGDKMIESGGRSDLQIEIFALEGDFPHASPKNWTAKKFNKHKANARDGRGDVLAGEGMKAQLKNGQCNIGSIKFTENSRRARSGKFIIGARVCEGEVSGIRVQEAVMNPVVVQDRRNKGNEKSHPPKLEDKVHRLEEIAKDGKYRKRLAEKNIFTVEDFLKALNKDPDNLTNILEISSKPKAWEKMTKHARECSLEGRHKLKAFVCPKKNVKLFFNCVHSLVGAELFFGRYTLPDNFSPEEQIIVAEVKKDAYANLDRLPEDHVMTDSSSNPIHIDTYSGVGAGPSNISSEQPNCSVHLAAVQVGSILGTEGLSHARIVSSCPNANNDPVTTSSCPNTNNDPVTTFSIPDHNSLHSNYQVDGIPVPPLEGSRHSQILCSHPSNNYPGTSSSIADDLYTYNHQDQGSRLAAQVTFSPLSNAMSQGPLEPVGSMFQFLSDEDAQLAFPQLQGTINNCGLDDVAIQSMHFWPGSGPIDASTSSHTNMTLTPQQLTIDGIQSSAEGSSQSQMQAPLPPSNGVPGATRSAQQGPSTVPPQQWSAHSEDWHGFHIPGWQDQQF